MTPISLTALRSLISGTPTSGRLRIAADFIDHGGSAELAQAEVLVLSVANELQAGRVRR